MNTLKDARKRGQLSWFVVLAVVFVVMIIILIVVAGSNTQNALKTRFIEKVQLSDEKSKLTDYIEGCIFKYGEEALILSGKQGGRIDVSDDYVVFVDEMVGYEFLSNEEIKKEISEYVAGRMPDCEISGKGFYNLTKGNDAIVDVDFDKEVTEFDVVFPVKLTTKEGDEEFFKDFRVSVPVRSEVIYDVARKVASGEEYISFLENMKLSVYLTNDYKVYVLADKKSTINGKSYKFVFAKKYR